MTAEAQHMPSFDPFEPPARPADAHAAAARLVDETVIHDLRNPLTSILGNMRLVEEMIGATLDKRMRDRLAASIQSAEELNAMLGDLQTLLWIDSGEFNQPTSAATVRDLVTHLSSVGQERADAAGRKLEIVSSADDLVVEGYIPQLQRALEVLLIAALRLGKDGPVRVEVAPDGEGRVGFSFRYAGLRVPPGLAPTLFGLESAALQRDYGMRVDRSRGLVMVNAVAALQGGEAAYTGSDDGGVFHLLIQRQAASPADAAQRLRGTASPCHRELS